MRCIAYAIGAESMTEWFVLKCHLSQMLRCLVALRIKCSQKGWIKIAIFRYSNVQVPFEPDAPLHRTCTSKWVLSKRFDINCDHSVFAQEALFVTKKKWHLTCVWYGSPLGGFLSIGRQYLKAKNVCINTNTYIIKWGKVFSRISLETAFAWESTGRRWRKQPLAREKFVNYVCQQYMWARNKFLSSICQQYVCSCLVNVTNHLLGKMALRVRLEMERSRSKYTKLDQAFIWVQRKYLLGASQKSKYLIKYLI